MIDICSDFWEHENSIKIKQEQCGKILLVGDKSNK